MRKQNLMTKTVDKTFWWWRVESKEHNLMTKAVDKIVLARRVEETKPNWPKLWNSGREKGNIINLGQSWGEGILVWILLNTSWILVGPFFCPELELHVFALFSLLCTFLHFFSLLCTLCDFANVSFAHVFSLFFTSVHFCVTCVHFSALQILLVIKFEGTSALCTFSVKKVHKRFKLISNWFELISNWFSTKKRLGAPSWHQDSPAGWPSCASGLKIPAFKNFSPRSARKRNSNDQSMNQRAYS